MNVPLSTKKIEALRRMRSLGICSVIIADFKQNDHIQFFESPLGIGYWPNDKIKAAVREFEKEHNALVFSGIKSVLNFDGETQTHWSFLYVSDHPDEWSYDDALLRESLQMAYVFNENCPDCSETGAIGFARTVAGGLRRTA